jgi:ATP-binding cassette subfamily B protein
LLKPPEPSAARDAAARPHPPNGGASPESETLRERLTKLRASFALLPRAMRMVARVSPRGTVGLVVLTLVCSALPLAIAWVGKAIVDSVVAGNADAAFRWVAIELGLVVAQVGGGRGLALVRGLIGARLARELNVSILEKALNLQLSDFEDPAFYDQLTRARREASSRPITVVTETFDIVQKALTLVGYASVLAHHSPLVLGALVLASLPATVAEVHFGRAAFRLRNWRSPDTRRLMYLERILSSDDHAKEVKLYGMGPLLLDRYKELGETFTREDATLAVRRFRWATSLSLLATLVYYGAYGSMVLGAAAALITLGELTFYAVAFRQGQQSLQSILGGLGGMHEHSLYLSNLYAYLDRAPPAPLESADSAQGEHGPIRGHVRFEDVSFQYPGREGRWALRHVTLDVPVGQSLALVGHNGAGKTTFIKLLTGLYRPTEGRVLLDGRDVSSIPEAERFAAFAVVFQDFTELQLTLKENVAFGSVDHLDDDGRIGRAIERGGASSVVDRLPGGLESQLGRWFDKGVELSGGEWQKVALSRSFMREEAKVLVLDEPTAALDAEAEHAVFARFRELTRGRTSILISHRFPTVRMAERIVVIEEGQVREEGTHEALVSKGGLYARLFQLQAEGYR